MRFPSAGLLQGHVRTEAPRGDIASWKQKTGKLIAATKAISAGDSKGVPISERQLPARPATTFTRQNSAGEGVTKASIGHNSRV